MKFCCKCTFFQFSFSLFLFHCLLGEVKNRGSMDLVHRGGGRSMSCTSPLNSLVPIYIPEQSSSQLLAQTQTARSEGWYTNHDATAPQLRQGATKVLSDSLGLVE